MGFLNRKKSSQYLGLVCVLVLGLSACPKPPYRDTDYAITRDRLDEVVAGKGLALSPEMRRFYRDAAVAIEALQRGELAKARKLAERQLEREANSGQRDNPYLHAVAGTAEVAAAFIPLWKHYQQLRTYYWVVKIVLWLPSDLQDDAIRVVIRQAAAAATRSSAGGKKTDFEKINWSQLAASGEMIRAGFDRADAHLAKAEAAGIQLLLCPSCWRVDWNDDGQVDAEDALWEIEYDEKGIPIPSGVESYLRNPVFRFDVGDVVWLRAMLSFQKGVADVIRGYDWSELPALLHPGTDQVTLKLIDADAIRSAKQSWLTGLRHSARSREMFLAETDDYLEWVANPTQNSQPFPETLNESGYAGWQSALKELEATLMGGNSLPLEPLTFVFSTHIWRPDPAPKAIELGPFLDSPNDIVISRVALKKVAESRSLVDLRGFLQIALPGRIVEATEGIFDLWSAAVNQSVVNHGSSIGRLRIYRKTTWVN